MTTPTTAMPESVLPLAAVARTRAGSENRAILTAFGAALVDGADGATLDEARVAFARIHGREAPALFTTLAYGLLKRGVLERRGGRAGHTRLAPAGARHAAMRHPADDGEVVLAALERLSAQEDRWYATREVKREIRRAGRTLKSTSVNAVRKRLETLAKGKVRGDAAWQTPRVFRQTIEGTTGAPAVFWRIARVGPITATMAPQSAAESSRIAIRAAHAILGRPVSATELRWWAEWRGGADEAPRAGQDDQAAALERWAAEQLRAGGGRTLLAQVRRADGRAGPHAGRVVVASGDLRCHGGAPRRYSLGVPSAEALAQVGFEDTLRAVAPDKEWEEIRAIRAMAQRRCLPALAELAETRLRLLVETLSLAAAPVDAGTMLARVTESLLVLDTWVSSVARRVTRGSRQREIAQMRRAVEGAQYALRNVRQLGADGRAVPAAYARVGAAGLTTLDDLRPLAALVGRQFDLDERQAVRLVQHARRFPLSDSPTRAGRFVMGTRPRPLAGVDRVDAMLALCDAMPRLSASVRAQVRAGAALLGRVIRDADLLETLRAATPTAERPVQHAIMTALALLGEAPSPRAITGDAESADVAAYIVALGLSALPNAEVCQRIDALAAHGAPGSRQLVATAQRRARVGNRLALIP
jgi:hypothetical protein